MRNDRRRRVHRIGAAFLMGALVFGGAACSNDPEEQVDQTEEQLD